jgi:aminoglycoside phosphotransferase (APT) family kinase protein
LLGIDGQGREILSFLEGHVAWESRQPPEVCSDESLVRVAELVRQFHDLTAGTPLAGGQEVVCHNDLSPKNTVYRDLGDGLRPVAFLDWDLAASGRRVHDVAHLCWQFLRLGPSVVDPAVAVRRLRLVCDAYGLAERDGLAETVLWWQERCWRGIEAAAAAGEVAMVALRDAGVVAQVQAAWRWVAAHRHELEVGIR